jgi:hypothetical protein
MAKVLLTLLDDRIAPRFDLTTEVMIIVVTEQEIAGTPRTMLLPGPSADELCSLVLKEEVATLICGGIEDEHYQFLGWKKVRVIDRVIGESGAVLGKFLSGDLLEGMVVGNTARPGGGEDEKVTASI